MPTSRGFSLVEILLSVSVVFFIVTAYIGAIIYGRDSAVIAGSLTRAGFLSEEGIEAARTIRDGSYTNLIPGTHGLAISGSEWIFSGPSDAAGGFSRQVQVVPVDANRNTVTSTVSWQQNLQRPGSVNLVTRLTNWRKNNGAAVPIIPETTFNIPGPGSGTEISMYATGSAHYAVVTRISSADKELYIIDVTTPGSPTTAGTLEIGSTVNDIAVSGNFAYLATSDNANELQVVSLASPVSPVLVGTLNLSGNADAQTVTASGNNLYIGRIGSGDPEIYSVSVAVPASPVLLSTAEVGDSVWKVVLAQNNQYVYAAGGLNSGEFLILNVSNPSAITLVGTVNLAGTSDATAVEPFGLYAGVGRDNGEFYIVDVATPVAPNVIGGPIAIGNKINDLTIGPGDTYMFAGSSTVGSEVTVLDTATVTSPAIFFSVDLSGNEATGLIWDPLTNHVFGSATANTGELVVIKSP